MTAARFIRDPLQLLLATLLAIVVSPAQADEMTSADLIAVVTSAEATPNEKAIACEQLATRGDADAIRTLAGLLDDPQRSHYARYALQTNPAPAAGDAFRAAAARLNGDLLIGVINSIASRQDHEAVPMLIELLHGEEPSVAIAAAGALAAIGGDQALAALYELPAKSTAMLADPLLRAAAALQNAGHQDRALALFQKIRDSAAPIAVRRAAAFGLCRASQPDDLPGEIASLLQSDEDWKFTVGIQSAAENNDPAVTAALVAAFDNAAPARQQQVLLALRAGEHRAAIAAVRTATASQVPQVQLAAIAALGTLGNASDVERLVQLGTDADAALSNAAQAALERINDPHADGKMIELLQSSDASMQQLAASIIGSRRIAAAAPELLQMAATGSDNLRVAALDSLRAIAPPELLSELVDLLPSLSSKQEQQLATAAVLAAASKVVDRDGAASQLGDRMESWPPEHRAVLFDALRVVGGKQALLVVSAAGESPDRNLQDHATRVLGAWSTPDAAQVLLRLAAPDQSFAVRSLRGYLRIARQLNLDEATRLDMCRRALELATRPDERELAIELLARIPSAVALELAQEQLDPQLLGTGASSAVVQIAEQVAADHPEAARQAAQKVIDAGGGTEEDKETLSRARAILANP